MNDERKQWLKEQLADKSECQLFNFGENKGFDIHGDVVDLLDDNAQLEAKLEDEEGLKMQAVQEWNRVEADRDEYRNLYHMAEAKVLSRDALLEQLSEEQLTQDVAKAEEENEALRDGRDRWHKRWEIAYDILDTTQRRQYHDEEVDALSIGGNDEPE